MNKNIAVLGVDLGGTNVRVGKVVNGEILKSSSCIVPKNVNDPYDVVNAITSTIDAVFDFDVLSIGIGVPSLVDRKTGIVYDVQNIPSWKEINLKQILEEKYKVKVFLDNDANCFALGESLYGKGKNSESFVGLSIGTGVGAGIVNDGNLLDDKNCGSGEFGMLPYIDATFEDYCSGKFFESKYNTTGRELYERAENKDNEALKIFNEFGTHMGNIIKAIMFTVDPSKIIIGGSVAMSNKFFNESMMTEIQNFPYSNARKNIKVEYSEVKQPAILGAAAISINSLKKIIGHEADK